MYIRRLVYELILIVMPLIIIEPKLGFLYLLIIFGSITLVYLNYSEFMNLYSDSKEWNFLLVTILLLFEVYLYLSSMYSNIFIYGDKLISGG